MANRLKMAVIDSIHICQSRAIPGVGRPGCWGSTGRRFGGTQSWPGQNRPGRLPGWGGLNRLRIQIPPGCLPGFCRKILQSQPRASRAAGATGANGSRFCGPRYQRIRTCCSRSCASRRRTGPVPCRVRYIPAPVDLRGERARLSFASRPVCPPRHSSGGITGTGPAAHRMDAADVVDSAGRRGVMGPIQAQATWPGRLGRTSPHPWIPLRRRGRNRCVGRRWPRRGPPGTACRP